MEMHYHLIVLQVIVRISIYFKTFEEEYIWTTEWGQWWDGLPTGNRLQNLKGQFFVSSGLSFLLDLFLQYVGSLSLAGGNWIPPPPHSVEIAKVWLQVLFGSGEGEELEVAKEPLLPGLHYEGPS